jgi:hypothetical protein
MFGGGDGTMRYPDPAAAAPKKNIKNSVYNQLFFQQFPSTIPILSLSETDFKVNSSLGCFLAIGISRRLTVLRIRQRGIFSPVRKKIIIFYKPDKAGTPDSGPFGYRR